jgi:hypothetical protein
MGQKGSPTKQVFVCHGGDLKLSVTFLLAKSTEYCGDAWWLWWLTYFIHGKIQVRLVAPSFLKWHITHQLLFLLCMGDTLW